MSGFEFDNNAGDILFDGYEYASTKVNVKTYSISAELGQPNTANLRLTDSGNMTDDVTFVGGVNVSVIRVDGNTISISSSGGGQDTNTTYSISAETSATPKAANLRLAGSDNTNDDVTLVGGTNVNVVRTDQNTLTINAAQASFLNITDGNNTAVADAPNDTFTLSAGTGIGVVVNAVNDTATISNTGVTAITAGTGITTSGSGNVTVNNDGVTTFNSVKGAITYNSFGTMSDGNNTAIADQANDTFTFVSGNGIGVLVNSGGDNVTISNNGVVSLNGNTGATYTYSTFTDGANPTTASVGNTTMTLSGSNGIKVLTSANTATISMNEVSKILNAPVTIPLAPSGANNFFSITNMPANSAAEIRGVILVRFSAPNQGNTLILTLSTGGSFTRAGVTLQLASQDGEITSDATTFNSGPLGDSNIHVISFQGVIVNGNSQATPSISINNNSGQTTLDILAKSFIKYNFI